MKKRLLSILIGLVFIVGANVSAGMAQGLPICKTQALLGPDGPDMCVSVVLGEVAAEDPLTVITKDSFLLAEAIMVVVSLENVGSEDIFTSKGFSAKDFRLDLHFTYTRPDGKKELITANLPTPEHEPPPPRVKLKDRKFVQVEEVEVLDGPPTRWVWTLDPFNALDFYSLDRVGRYSVKTFIAMRTYPASAVQTSSEAYAPIGSSDWSGVLESNSVDFTIMGDVDGDGYYYPEAPPAAPPEIDCDDNNPNVHPYAEEIVGNGIDDDCDPATLDASAPCTLNLKVDRHVVGGGSYPGSSKYPLDLVEVRVFDKSQGSCVRTFGVSWQNYEDIFNECDSVPMIGGATYQMTVAGMCTMSLPPGDFIVIGKYDPDIYEVGVPVPDEDDIYIGVSVGVIEAGQTVDKYLQIIEKADGKKVPAKYTKRKGSELLIIEPEYVEWDGTQELYPFIFESIGDWEVSTSVSPPEGFVADNESLSEQVNTELEAVQFTITDVGSKWMDTEVIHDLTHKDKKGKVKKKEKIKSKIGVKLKKTLAKKKGLDKFGKKIK